MKDLRKNPILSVLALLVAGCNSSAIVRTGLTARPSPIEVKGVRIEATLFPPTRPGMVREALVVATAPPEWTRPFELALSSEGDPAGPSGVSSTSAHRVQIHSSVSPSFEKGDDRIFGRISTFATADETITLKKASVVEYAPGRYFLKLDSPETLATPSGFKVTFPKQTARFGGNVTGSPSDPTLRFLCVTSLQGQVAALGNQVPQGYDPEDVTVSILDEMGANRSWSANRVDGASTVDQDVQIDYPTKKVGEIGPLKFTIRHRADLEVIPFAVIAVPPKKP